MKQIKLQEGMQLITKYPERFTNASVFILTDNNEVIVLTDFGNLRTFTSPDRLFEQYYVSENYLELLALNYPLPTPLEHIEEQLTLLNKAKELLL